MTVRKRALAKINLALHVTGQRQDGYHMLDSVVTFAEIGDVLHFEKSDALTLKITGPEANALSVEEDNLVLRAARLLIKEIDKPNLHATIALEKNLPVASGIGGGSADAAAALRGLIELWEIDVAEDRLAQIGLALGADVPMSLYTKPCRAGGIGENLQAVSVPQFPIVLANPRVSVSTPVVFEHLHVKTNPPLHDLPLKGWIDWLQAQRNDLQSTAIKLVPEIPDVLTALSQVSGCRLVRMSGSGATCFGLFETDADAENASRAIAALYPEWWVVASRTV